MREPVARPTAEALLKEIGDAPRLTVYLAGAPGAGKTHRLIEDALRARTAGVSVVVGWLETKGRPDLDAMAEPLKRIAPRTVSLAGATFSDFDFEATIAARPQLVILDELAHSNLEGGAHAKRWQDALALYDRGISVSGALNVQHVESVAPIAETLIGFPVREIVPLSFLRRADAVVALDVSPEQLEARLRAGRVVGGEDVERALGGAFRAGNLRLLRELMLRTVDDLTVPSLRPSQTSTALALVTADADARPFVRQTAAIAHALDLALEVAVVSNKSGDDIIQIAADSDARVVTLTGFDQNKPRLHDVKAALVAVPRGALAVKIAGGATDRDIFVADDAPPAPEGGSKSALGFGSFTQTAGDRMRIGYGRLTIYLGAAAGSGKTYAMLDRAHELVADGVDLVAAFVETHGRADTVRMLDGLPELPRKTIVSGDLHYEELDLDALLERHPAVALIDELAHTNAPGSRHAKRFDDVMTALREGISVITTLNVQHFEGLSDAVTRLTGQRVREAVPDSILQVADDVVLIDTTPETLRERLRQGKIYPAARVESALANFFRKDNLAALRELVLREVTHTRDARHQPAPFARLVLGVKARERDVELIERCARIALRLEIELSVVHVLPRRGESNSRALTALEAAARRTRAEWLSISGESPVAALLGAARGGSGTIAIEGARSKPRWPANTTFARRLLEAGARQVLILAPWTGN